MLSTRTLLWGAMAAAILTSPGQSAPTSKPATSTKSVRFAVWGDSGSGTAGQKALARRIETFQPSFLLHTGDLIYPRGQRSGYKPFFWDIYGPLLKKARFYGALGNHDIMTEKGQPWLDNLVLPRNGPSGLTPERNYSFDQGAAHIVVLDSTASERVMKTKIVPWLERDLKASCALWKIVVFHHPPFSSGLHGNSERTRQFFVPVLERNGVNVVFCGHDHHYERFKPRGRTLYIMDGAGGAVRYPRRTQNSQSVVFDNSDWSFTAVEMTPKLLRARQISAKGKVLDQWELKHLHY